MHSPTLHPEAKPSGRWLLGLGVALAILGVAIYMIVFSTGRLQTPWYMAALATLGVGLIVLSLIRRVTGLRVIAVLFFTCLMAFEWWALLWGTTLPDYSGPVAVGKPFPDFTAAIRADGTPFGRQDLQGEEKTVLVFFRGFW